MALISCPECGKQVSDQATLCPDCGYPLKIVRSSSNTEPKRSNVTENDQRIVHKKRLTLLLVIILIAGGLFLCSKYLVPQFTGRKSNIQGVSNETYEKAMSALDIYQGREYNSRLEKSIEDSLVEAYGDNVADTAMEDIVETVSAIPMYTDAIQQIDEITSRTSGVEVILENNVRTYWGLTFDNAVGVALGNDPGGTYMYKIACLLSEKNDLEDANETRVAVYSIIMDATSEDDLVDTTPLQELLPYNFN